MDLQKQIINCIGLALFDRAALSCGTLSSQKEMLDLSKKHSISEIVGIGMQRSGAYGELIPEFENLGQKYLFQYARQSMELERVVMAFEQNKCPYVLLKGAKMRSFYDQPHLRTSCDIDILTNESDETVHRIMASLGYEFSVDAGTTINYVKKPAVEFEMHRRLFNGSEDFKGYFNDIWGRSVPAGADVMERYLTEEDFYVYMIAHLAKHVDHYGCGIRPFVDVYLYLQKKPKNFDLKKARSILKDIGLLSFEQRICALTKAWFETGKLSKTDEKLTKFIFGAGLYGNQQIKSGQSVRKSGSSRKGRFQLLLHHVFPPMRIMKPMYPRLLKCKLMLPLAWLLRGVHLTFFGRKKAASELEKINSLDDQFIAELTDIMTEFKIGS